MSATTAVSAVPVPARSVFDRKPFYTLVAVVGSLGIALTGLLFLGLAIATGRPIAGAVMPMLILTLPGLLLAGLVWRFGKWVHLLSLLAGLAFTLLFAPSVPFVLSHPEGGVEFIVMLVFVSGALLAIVGSGAGIVQWLRKTAVPGANAVQRRALQVVLGLVLLLALGSIAATATARTSVSAEARTGAIAVTIADFKFAPNSVRAKAGEMVRLVIRNDDSTLHTFTFKEAAVDISVPPGAEKLVEFRAPAAGTYTFYCVPHSHEQSGKREGMTASLIVE